MADDIVTQPGKTNKSGLFSGYASCPEMAFCVDDISQIDMLNCLLERSVALLELLQQDGCMVKEGFKSSHVTIIDTLAAIDGFVNQAQQVVASIPYCSGGTHE